MPLKITNSVLEPLSLAEKRSPKAIHLVAQSLQKHYAKIYNHTKAELNK